MIDCAPDLLSLFIHEVATQTGIVIRDRDRASFAKKLNERVQALRQTSFQAYYDWLFAIPQEIHDRSTARGAEWQRIIQQISITESYFFRDRGQFQLLREQILPRIIAERRQMAQTSGQRPCLKVWSAASSTGEEPYSLAILVWELLADLPDWDVQVIGTDINEAALTIARRGFYSDWSFRQVDPAIRDQYFTHRNHLRDKSWQLHPKIAKLVTFLPLNLSQSHYPNPNLGLVDVDLILCRNVFIYLDGQTIQGILDRMARTLNSTGYLLTAHAELQHQNTGSFKAQLCPQSVVYQRQDSVSPLLAEATSSPSVTPSTTPSVTLDIPIVPPFAPPLAPPSTVHDRPLSLSPHLMDTSSRHPQPKDNHPTLSNRHQATSTSSNPSLRSVPTPADCRSWAISACPPASHNSRSIEPNSGQQSELNRKLSLEQPIDQQIEQAITLFHRGDYPATITLLDQLLTQAPQNFPACDLLSLAYANLGQYNQASYYCSKALEIDACATSPYYLMAHLAENSGNIARAKTLLKRIVYLDPEAALAYLELAALYRIEGDTLRAEKMERTARILLAARDASEILDPYRRLSVGAVLQQLQQPNSSQRLSMTLDSR